MLNRGSPHSTRLSEKKWLNKSAGYDATSYFLSAVKCNYILHKRGAKNGSGRSKSQIIRPLFNLDSPNVARTCMPALYTAKPDMTSPAASDRHLSKFEKTAENSASGGFESNFSSAAFCQPLTWWASCWPIFSGLLLVLKRNAIVYVRRHLCRRGHR